jgi:uncharacterized membrane protein (DUF2068 family)
MDGAYRPESQQHYPALLMQAVDRVNATPVHTLVWLGGLYITVRWVEAWGLWQDRAWVNGWACCPAASMCPGGAAPAARPHWQGAAVLLINLALLAVLALRLRERRREPVRVEGP